jgi:diketogulonate reductase-like aldo/keto reductase
MTSEAITAASAGTWQLGDFTVNRIGFGAMRLTGSAVFDRGTPSKRDQSISVLRRAVELGVNHIDTAAFYFSRSGCPGPRRSSCAARSRRTCASSASTISTW